jgi:hypothetical protein
MIGHSARNITVLAAALLVGTFLAFSCDGGGGGGDHPSARSICSDMCEAYSECEGWDFDDDDMQDCIDDCVDGYDNDDFDGEDDCDGEWLDYQGCYWETYLEDCDWDDVDSECDDEADDYYDCWSSSDGDSDIDGDSDMDIDTDGDSDGDTDYDYENMAACQDAEDEVNSLSCYSEYPADWYCENYTGYPCYLSDFFDCYASCHYCDADYPAFDSEYYDEVCVSYLDECYY